MTQRPQGAHPSARPFVLEGLLFAGAVTGAAWLLWRPPTSFYVYNVPIAVPFAMFLGERWELHRHAWHAEPRFPWIARLATDLVVVALSLSRVFYATPFVSGHVLFLAHATFTAETRASRVVAALVLAQVLFMKLVLFHDYGTPTGALLIAGLAAVAWRSLRDS